MKYCKKCGEEAKPNTWQTGYYCSNCGNLNFDDVKEYRYSKFEYFTDDELNTLSHAMESPWGICVSSGYSEYEVSLYEKLINEIVDEIKRRKI